MAKILKKEFKKDAVNHTLFLSSIKSWYSKKGVHCGVEKVGNFFKDDRGRPSVSVHLSILDDMPKCRARVLDEKGQLVKEEDERTGEEVTKIEIIKDPQEVTFFFKVSENNEVKAEGTIPEMEDEEYIVFNKASAFPLFNLAFINFGEIPEGNKESFSFTHEELKEALEGLEFHVFTEAREFKGKKYNVLIPKLIEEETIDMVEG